LFVGVTVVASWLGWNLNIVRERARLRKLMFDRGVSFSAWISPGERIPEATTPFVRRIMGDKGLGMIWNLDDLTEREVADLRRAFPEADMIGPGDPRLSE
jgi:hypothetical protein